MILHNYDSCSYVSIRYAITQTFIMAFVFI